MADSQPTTTAASSPRRDFFDLPRELRNYVYGYMTQDDVHIITTKRLAKTRNPSIQEKKDFGFTSRLALDLGPSQMYTEYREIQREHILKDLRRVRVRVRNLDFNNVRKFVAALEARQAGLSAQIDMRIGHDINGAFDSSGAGLDRWVQHGHQLARNAPRLQTLHRLRNVEETSSWWDFFEARMDMCSKPAEGEWRQFWFGLYLWMDETNQPLIKQSEDAVERFPTATQLAQTPVVVPPSRLKQQFYAEN